MISNGLIEEAKSLFIKNYDKRALNTAIGYKEIFSYFKGDLSKEEAIEKIKQNSRHYAKRQYTFFNNQFDNIKWYNVDDISLETIVYDM